MPLLTRDMILQANDLPTEDVEVPEWGGAVRVRTLSGRERDQFEASVVEQHGKRQRIDTRDLRAKLVALAVVDERGQRMFTEADVVTLSGKSAAALQRVFDVARRLSGLSDQDVEELEKN